MRRDKLFVGSVCLILVSLVTLAPVEAPAQESAPEPASGGIEIGSALFGTLRARAIGPAVMGGRIAAMDVVDADPRFIYVGAASGGVWKSTNGGTTFKAIFDDYPQSIGAIAIDQAHPDTVWVGTGEPWVRNSVSVGKGLYKSADGGESWKLKGLEDSERIAGIIVCPDDADVVYVAAMGHLWDASDERGLYKTTDGGESWERILFVDENTGCCDLAIDPQEPDVLYAAMWDFRRQPDFFRSGGPGSGLYRSMDAGQNWQRLTDGLPEGELGRIAVAVAPSRASRVYALVEAEETGLYRSDDLGGHWQRVSTAPAVQERPFYFGLLEVDPSDHDRVYKPSTGLYVSKDGGETFSGVGGRVHVDYHAMWINPRDPAHILVGNDGGVYVTRNHGGAWRYQNSLPISQFYRISCDDAQPYNVYGGLQDNGSWCAPSRSPGGIENSDWENLGGGDGFEVLADPTDDDIVYWEYQGGNVSRKHLSTGENKDIKPQPAAGEPDYRFNWNTPIVLSPTDPTRLYVGCQFLMRSLDRGESWQRLSDDLTTNDPDKQRQRESGGLTVDNTTAENHCTIYAIAESPRDESVIWVGTDDGNLQVTVDDGKTWRKVSGNIPDLPAGTWCSSIAASQHDRATAYVTFDGHRTGDVQSYIYRTTDLGSSWQSLATEDIEGYVHVIREDPVNPDLLFAGTEFGLYITLDGGLHWARFEENLPQVSVRDLVIQARESDLVIGTHGRGVYIIDDITPLRQITAEAIAADVFLLDSPQAMARVPRYKQHSPGDAYFIGGNPSRAAKIIYHLKKRHMFGDLKLEIFSPDGELLKTLPGGKRKGINRVSWRLRLKPPKVAPSPVLDPMSTFAAMFGPTAPEGTYTYNLTKGKETYTGSIDVVADPLSPHSAKDRALQQKTVMQLHGMIERLSYVAEAIAGARDDARERAEELKEKDKLRKKLTGFADDLDAQHRILMVTEDKQGITGEKQLREKLIRLYAGVGSYGGRPSESQLMRIPIFEEQIAEAEAEFHELTSKRLKDLNEKLQKKDLAPIELLTEEEFKKRDE